MGIIKDEDIAGYHFENGEVACKECVEDEELKHIEEKHIITTDETEKEDVHFFCDRF